MALLLVNAAQACSVCFSATDENRFMFVATTGLLTFAPLLLVGSFVWWLRRKVKAREAARAC